MLKKILAAALACAVLGTTPLSAAAASSDNSSAQSEENSSINYIHSEIAERSIPSYGLYEEIIANQVVFYSNVKNGDIIEYAVSLDLPETISVSAEKDGKKVNYTPGELFEAPGRYTLTLTVEGKDLLGGGENDVYYGLFRFWIMESSESDPDGDNSDDSDYSDDESSDYSDESSDSSDFSSDIDGDSSSDESGNTDDPQNPDDPASETGKLLPETDKAAGLSQYLVGKKIRAVTDRGTEFFCNIPAGMTTTNVVQLELPDTAEYKMLINGEESANFEFNKSISARGEYKLLIIDGDSENPSEFSFTVIGKNINKITQFSVPNGCRIAEAKFNKTAIRANGNTVDLGEDGTYSFDVYCGEYLMEESFTLDNTPPEFIVNGIDENGKAQDGKVFIELVSDDIEDYAVYLNTKPYKKTLELTEAGKYGIIVYDKAGNSSKTEFEIIYHMNSMAIIAVILAGALVAAGIVFFIITRKKFSIR